jgi:hypothetical protein
MIAAVAFRALRAVRAVEGGEEVVTNFQIKYPSFESVPYHYSKCGYLSEPFFLVL